MEFPLKPIQPPTVLQIKLLKQIYNKELQIARTTSMWKQINLLEKKGLIMDDNDVWVITKKGRSYI
jgi:predicted transcriptional regulator